MAKTLRLAFMTLCLGGSSAFAAGTRIFVNDPMTGSLVPDAVVTISQFGSGRRITVLAGTSVDLKDLSIGHSGSSSLVVSLGQSQTLQEKQPIGDAYITVTASRLRRPQSDASNGTTRTQTELNKFGGSSGDVKNVVRTTAGAAEDSGGQQHVRGEHTEISYVVDGVPLPDTLSGREGAIVVPSTVQSVDVLLGGFAPEFGGQTAAVLDIKTLPRAKRPSSELAFSGGSYDTMSGDLTATGPIGGRGGYTLHLAGDRTGLATDAQQPDHQDAHNAGEDRNAFAKLAFQPSSRDWLTLTVSTDPNRMQIGNRTGLPSSFAEAGEGFGFLGARNADGTRPDANGDLGSGTIVLKSQQDAGMDINQRETNEFATLTWRRQLGESSFSNFGLVFLHSGQDLTNNNPAVNVLDLPIDNSIEFNPTAYRNVHHVQLNGDVSLRTGQHSLKTGFLVDGQSGHESYQLIPASQLALDALAATAPDLAPPGHPTGAIDINGNQVYQATGPTPTLTVDRNGYYAAAFLQDTWRLSKRLTLNYGLRGDWYSQSQNLGQPTVDTFELSPRVNLSWAVGPRTVLRASYDKLFNTPPLAQGAIVGQPLEPPIVRQYDVSFEQQLDTHQSVKLAYYMKDIQNQIDVGLLIPGSELGLYSGVNLERGGVHGLEFSYEVAGLHGWDAYFNYTLSAAKPNGVDSTGEPVDDYNDHDQRQTIGIGVAYTFKSGATLALTGEHGSGLASSVVPPSEARMPRTQVDVHFSTGPKLFNGHGGLNFDVSNVFDSREVINFQSAFSGTRFQTGRRVSAGAFFRF